MLGTLIYKFGGHVYEFLTNLSTTDSLVSKSPNFQHYQRVVKMIGGVAQLALNLNLKTEKKFFSK
jgi:UDP-galactopyranose mutase